MAVDLGDLIEDLRAEINPPGVDLYPTATDDDWINRLRNAFWEARIGGAFIGYRESDGLIAPVSGIDELPREQQQLIILYAGLNVVLADFRNTQSAFKAKAGPVEYETQRSATLLKGVLDLLKTKLASALDAAINGPSWSGTTAVFDSVIARTESIAWGDTWWVR